MKITEEVYALDSTKGNYAYLILGKENVLIDTGHPGQAEDILEELRSMNIRPEDIKNILITHHDVDHVGNLVFMEKETDAEVWASGEDIPYILGDKSRPGFKKIISFFLRARKPEKIRPYPKNQRINNVEIIPTPGHTPGHVCILYKDVLFAGDLVRNSKGQLKPSTSYLTWNKSILSESIKKIAEYRFKWICPAHGEPVRREDAIGSI